MITPSFALTATERVLPSLALDFTTAVLDPRVTLTRSGNTATVTNSSGVIVAINADLPRFDFNPTTLVCKGLLIEEARTNDLVNSLIDGTDLATQLVTVTAAARTLSFYGTGTVVLSGAHSATVVGTGAYPARTTLTFTPSAGVLTLTVTGTVQFAQLEAGVFATSFIPTAATAVTRNADIATMTGTNFSDWFNATEGAFTIGYNTLVNNPAPFSVDDGSMTNRFQPIAATGVNQFYVVVAGSLVVAVTSGATTLNTNQKLGFGYKLDNYVYSSNAAAVATDTSAGVPTANTLRFGRLQNNTSIFSGTLQNLYYWPQRLINNEVRSFTK
jgi:hypothetical protein